MITTENQLNINKSGIAQTPERYQITELALFRLQAKLITDYATDVLINPEEIKLLEQLQKQLLLLEESITGHIISLEYYQGYLSNCLKTCRTRQMSECMTLEKALEVMSEPKLESSDYHDIADQCVDKINRALEATRRSELKKVAVN